MIEPEAATKPNTGGWLPQQTELLEIFTEKDERLAKIYLGYLYAIQDRANPDRLSQAAHSLRELQEKIPRYLDLPLISRDGSLGGKLTELQPIWEKVPSINPGDDLSKAGSIGLAAIKAFLLGFSELMKWHKEQNPTRRKKTSAFLRRFDPSGMPSVPAIETRRIKFWTSSNEFFQKIAHHQGETSDSEFLQTSGQLERFLLTLFRPTTFEDFSAIDDLLRP